MSPIRNPTAQSRVQVVFEKYEWTPPAEPPKHPLSPQCLMAFTTKHCKASSTRLLASTRLLHKESRYPTTSFLTATTLIYAIGAGITAAAGTRLALQWVLVKRFKLYSFQLQSPKGLYIVIYCHYLPVSGLGNLRACCLPWMW